MRISASAWYELYNPSECAKRVRLIAAGVQGAEPGAYEVVLEELGKRHEANYLATLGPPVHIAAGSDEERMAAALEAIHSAASVIYQPFFKITIGDVELVGNPDFLVLTDAGYLIRDAKLARHTAQDEKPEIWHQLQSYGFLYETVVGHRAAGLQVYDGLGNLQDVPYEGADAFGIALAQLVRLRTSPLETYEPCGWSKCQSCPFKSTCWAAAEAKQDVSLVYGVSQEMAISLQDADIATITVLANMDRGALSQVAYRWGDKVRTVSKAAESIQRSAQALRDGREIAIQPPVIPQSANYVSFDLEGLPPGYELNDRIYLWGIQVYGANPGPYQGITSDFGPDGDRNGWLAFLKAMGEIFETHGDLPLIVYSAYEATHVRQYIQRHGDWNGVGARVLRNIWDMLPEVRKSVALPLYSYSLKQVEQHVGFQRTQDEFGGSWSVAHYIKAIETADSILRDAIVGEILTYNKEDVEATWRIFEWLRALA
jgi:uncharacterized protein